MKATRNWLTTGTLVRNYTIDSRIAAIGTGEVYLAKELGSKRAVALKILPAPAHCTVEQLGSLAQRMNKQSLPSHPAICETYEVGVTEDGKLFIASEYISGQSLDTLMSAGVSFYTENIAEQIAMALQAAHEAGRVHTDLKFSNVMLTPSGEVKVLDFEMAAYKQFCQQNGQESDALADLQPSRVRHYSPEHVHSMPCTAQTDLFSLGTMLYEMLTGTPAFSGTTPIKVCAAIIWNKPEPIVNFVPRISPTLAAAIAKLLEKDVAQRTSSAKAFLAELKELPVSSTHPVAQSGGNSYQAKHAGQNFFFSADGQMVADFGKGLWQYMFNDGATFAFLTLAALGACYALSTFFTLIHLKH